MKGIVLAGGLVEAMPDLIRREVQKAIDSHCSAVAREGLQIVVSKLNKHVITKGAAKMALDLIGRGV